MTAANGGVQGGSRRFGTFGGVFTPNVLTILGVILFLRAGWVVGNVGLAGAVVIIILANVISLFTGLSLSAIATSMDVKAGGNYYMISRALGLEIGGSIGLTLYISQALSIAFYLIGFTEGLLWTFPDLDPVLTASLTCVLLTAIALVGAGWAVKAQYFILGVLVMSIVSFFCGWRDPSHEVVWWARSEAGFWAVFAVFFPAVTGIEVGVSMSGDLKEPGVSIPRGTLLAIGITCVIYLWQAAWLSLNMSGEELISDLSAMRSIARWPVLVVPGLWAATISSALGCIMAAPRTLQALAKDGILLKALARGAEKTNEPRLATLVTFVIAEGCILMGGLDAVAPVITMFFLNTYGVINLIATLETAVSNPSYRPRLKVPWYVSLSGAVGCYAAMFLINAAATAVAMIFTVLVFVYLTRKEIDVTWGDVRSGVWYSLAKFAVLRLEEDEPHPLNWKPNLLVFSGNPNTRSQLIHIANWICRKRGLVVIYQLLIGKIEKLVNHRAAAQKLLRNYIRESELQALGQVHIAESMEKGVLDTVQSNGLGKMNANLILLGWCGQPCRNREFAAMIRDIYHLEKSVLILNLNPEFEFRQRRRIAVWWGGMAGNGKLMLLLAHLIGENPAWGESVISLNMIIQKEQARERAQVNLESILQEANIKARVNIIVQEPQVQIPLLIRRHSRDADLVILGMSVPQEGEEERFMEKMNLFLAGLPTTLLVKSVEDIELTV